MANDYTTSSDAFLDISEGNFSSSDYPVMASLVTVASRRIDSEMGRWDGFFYPSTDLQTFYYDGSGEECQDIDEFVSISQLSVAEQGDLTDYTNWTLNTDYLTRPYNATNIHKPINKLEILSFNGTKFAFFDYQKSVKVIGIPGYSLTPPDIVVQACKIQAIRWFTAARQSYQVTGSSDKASEMDYSKLDGDIVTMLKPLILELS